ncbi:MAG: carboxypeptidase-like regulatory domain-containing protein, partial [Bacteroidota bacterium]
MRVAILFMLLTSAVGLFAQDRVTATFNNATFPEVAKAVEEQTPLRLFYDARLLDTLRITLTANALPVTELLTSVFSGSEFNFSQDDQRNIYITWRRAIVTGLPAGLLPGTAGARDQEASVDASLFDKKVRDRDANKDRVYVIGKPTRKLSGQAVVTGYVRDARTGEQMAGVAVFIKDPLIGTTTDPLGQYTIKLPRGRRVLTFQSLGMKQEERILMLYDDGTLDVEMIEEVTSLKDVVISADRDRAVQGLQMGKEKL